MTLRRLTTMLVVCATCGATFSLGALVGRPGSEAAAEWSAPASWLVMAHAPALAQEVMQFKPVPAESVAALTRRGRSATAPAAPAVPAPPAAGGAAPVPPAPPVPPLSTDESGNVVRFGSDIVIREGQTVHGDVVAMGGDVTVEGHVEGEVVAMGGDVRLGPTGRVDGQVVTLGGHLIEQPGSHVGGQRVTASGLPRGWFPGSFFGFLGFVDSGLKAAWAIAKMLVVLLVAWGFTQLAPTRTQVAFEAFKNEPIKCLGFGLLAWALIIPSIVALALVVAILCITIIGIPIAIAVVLGYALAIVLLAVWGYVVGVAVLGERLARQLGRAVPSLTLMAVWGIVALTAVRVVGHLFGGLPMGGAAGGLLVVLASVVGAVLMTVGAGALLCTQLRRDSFRTWWPGARAAASPPPGTAPSATAATAAPAPPAAPTAPIPYSEPPAS